MPHQKLGKIRVSPTTAAGIRRQRNTTRFSRLLARQNGFPSSYVKPRAWDSHRGENFGQRNLL